MRNKELQMVNKELKRRRRESYPLAEVAKGAFAVRLQVQKDVDVSDMENGLKVVDMFLVGMGHRTDEGAGY